jgi:HlyD family secretion protein
MKRSRIIILVIIIAVAAGGYFFYQNYRKQQASAQSNFQTVKLSRGNLTSLIGATGTVRANQTAEMIWQATGTVGKINVEVGEKVSTGQVLAELDTNSLPQNIILAQADLVTAQRNLDNLRNSSLARANAEQTLANAQKAVDDAQKKMDSKSYTNASQDVIDTAYANYILAQNEVNSKQDAFTGVEYKAEDDPDRAAALSTLAAAKQKRDIALANYNQAKSKPAQVDVNIAKANLEMAKANLNDAQREWDRLKNGVDPKDTAAAEAKVQAIQSTISTAKITAPFNGTITEVSSSPGDQTSPGTKAFRVDDLSRMLVDVQITEVDINRVKVGEPVNVTFDAIPNKEYKGKVVEVGQVGTAVQGVVNFSVTVEIESADQSVLPGMTSAVNIVVDELKDVLMVPNRAVRVRNGQRIVYILRNGKAETVDVKIGAISDTNSEIKSGDVKEGDLVILNPPTTSGSPFGGGPPGGPGGGGPGGGPGGGG